MFGTSRARRFVSHFELTVEVPNAAHGLFGKDFWQIECNGPIFQDPSRSGRVHDELLEVRDRDRLRVLPHADEDAVLNDSTASQYR